MMHRSGILRFRSVKIQSMTRTPNQCGHCHHCCYSQLVWGEEFGSGLSATFDVNKAFIGDLSSFHSLVSYFLLAVSGHVCEQTVLCGVPSSLCAGENSTGVAQDPDLSLLLTHCSLPGKAITSCLGRELIVLIAAQSSPAPRPVPENRCEMCPILSRWTCYIPLTVVVQLSLTLWVNSSSILHQSPNRQRLSS